MRIKMLASLIWLMPFAALAQQDSLSKKLDSLKNLPRELKRSPKDSINRKYYNENTKLNVHRYFLLLGSDFKQQAVTPFQTKKTDWLKVAKFSLITAGILLCDEPVQRFTVNHIDKSKTVVSTSSYVTKFGGLYEAYVLGSLGAYGFIFNSAKIKTTTFLATQAYLTSGAVESVLKFLTGRQRPFYYDSTEVEREPTWHGPFYQFKKDKNGKKPDAFSYSSFPSGHTTVAFAAATVFAMEYSDRPLVPIISYSVASLIGLSRITENKHWASDVLVGAALGYLCGRQVVNNYHRFAKVQSEQKKKNTMSFNLQYSGGKIMPGVVYKFK